MFGVKVKNDYEIKVDERRVNKVVDYTLLSPSATAKDIEKFLCTAHKNKYYAVCVNPINVAYVRRFVDYKFKGDLKVVSVVGFPLGEHLTETKIYEMKQAIKDGADEIDIVAPISRIVSGDWGYVKNELTRARRCARKKILKVIIETALLTKQEIIKASQLCVKCKVDYVKTSTGFADGGATPEIVDIIKSAVKNKCGIKASGGIQSKAQAVNLIRAGATRIGTSREI